MNISLLLNYFKKTFQLSFSLAKSNFKLRTEGSYLGIFWYLLDPLLLFLVLFIIFSKNLGSQIEHYPLYLIWGLILFNFFSSTTTQAISIISNNSSFIKSIKINIESLIIANSLQTIFSHFFELIIFIIFLIYFNLPLIGLIVYPVIFLCFIIFIFGVSLILATIGVYTTDLNNIWKFIIQVLFFATPIFYISETSLINTFNPLYYFLKISRDLLIYQEIPTLNIIIITIFFSFLSLILGICIFNKYHKNFPEHI
jgi:lipopolysaccharide transport system permease protein